MLPIKKILCPTDFSDPSFEAIKVANELAVHFSSWLCLIHVVSLTPVLATTMVPSAFNVDAYQKALEESGKEQLNQVMEKYVSKEIKTSKPTIVSGVAADEIIRFAEAEQIDLIVIATHGLTGWRHFVYGSVAESVVQHAPCPVLAIRPPHKSEEKQP
ncbi:MAG: universal stress protein [Chloroflexota bacterium]